MQMTANFTDFWQACPRKVGKGRAMKAWAHVLKHGLATPDQMVRAMKAQAVVHSEEATPICFICHPTTWLHDMRWDDDPEAYRRSKRTDRQQAWAADLDTLDAWDFTARDRERLQ